MWRGIIVLNMAISGTLTRIQRVFAFKEVRTNPSMNYYIVIA